MKKKKGLSIEECIKRAEKLIEKNGICLLLFDIKGSREITPVQKFGQIRKRIIDDLNYKFSKYMPQNKLRVPIYQDKGFVIIRGDCGVAGINSPEAVQEIIEYQQKNYPKTPCSWSIAENGFDDDGFSYIGA